MKLRLPNSFYNPISYVGAVIAVIALFMFVFLYVLASFSTAEQAYIGIVIFLVIPSFVIFGLLLIPIGMLRRYRQEKKGGEIPKSQLPILDLNNKRHRNATIIFTLGTVVFLFLSALGSYEAYHYTESVEFCGKLCHEIMEPEYTAYLNSPHARVTCAECHVGAGANWYVKSKLSGVYQVYAALVNNYPQPIPTPIENLRPARETCEECHWPQKIYGKQQRTDIYILPDENNTRYEIDLLLNIGGGNPALGHGSGIHWHINEHIEIEYVTTDEERSTIPLVILRNTDTGEETVFEDENNPFDAEEAEYVERRVMDCMDCHNRPSHRYDDPGRFINIAIVAGDIPTTLPEIKLAAVEACLQEYESDDAAMQGIAEHIGSFYNDNYADIADSLGADIEKAITGTQNAFSKNIFPYMNVSWKVYPDHAGHYISAGCMRCHNGDHVSDDGRVVTNTCNDCHIITAQGVQGDMTYAASNEGLDFVHPVDIDEMWLEMPCYDCHSTPPVDLF